MDLLVKTVTTGDLIVFDKKNRELVLVDAKHGVDPASIGSMKEAMRLVESGKAQHYSRGQLERVQSALAGVVLLV